MGVATQLGSLANVYSIIEETKDLAVLRIRGEVSLESLQSLYDRGFKVLIVDKDRFRTTIVTEKPKE